MEWSSGEEDSPSRPQGRLGKQSGTAAEPLPVEPPLPDAAPQLSGMQLLADPELLKERIRLAAHKPEYDVLQQYHTKGFFQWLARHRYFDWTSSAVVATNCVWLAYDSDYNDATMLYDAQMQFKLMENILCGFFVCELFVRFMAFKRKCNIFKDAWFVFDSALVTASVVDTWIVSALIWYRGGESSAAFLTGNNSSILRMARIFRLSRLIRVLRLFRVFSELLIIVKGITAAARSVLSTIVLLLIFIYVFAISFRSLVGGTGAGDLLFSTTGQSMHTLLLYGTFLDNIEAVDEALQKEGQVYVAVLYLYILVNNFTVLNMLIGVLCTVITSISSSEKESIALEFVRRKMQRLLNTEGDDGHVSKEQFSQLLQEPEGAQTLSEVGVDVVALVDSLGDIFRGDDGEERDMSFEEFIDVILSLRGSNLMTIKDIVDFRKQIDNSHKAIRSEVRKAAVERAAKERELQEARQQTSVESPQEPQMGMVEAPKEEEPKEPPPDPPPDPQLELLSWRKKRLLETLGHLDTKLRCYLDSQENPCWQPPRQALRAPTAGGSDTALDLVENGSASSLEEGGNGRGLWNFFSSLTDTWPSTDAPSGPQAPADAPGMGPAPEPFAQDHLLHLQELLAGGLAGLGRLDLQQRLHPVAPALLVRPRPRRTSCGHTTEPNARRAPWTGDCQSSWTTFEGPMRSV